MAISESCRKVRSEYKAELGIRTGKGSGIALLLRADFHLHTKYSKDCDTPLEEIISRCQKTGINCIAVSDHGSAEGGLEMQKIAPLKVIVAEEILTPDGEIMGMFLKETIPSGVSIEEAISRIRAQDGLVCLPHPFDPLRGLKLNNGRIEELAGQVDIIEMFNARSATLRPAFRAETLALKYDLPMTAGSDAHYPFEIGRTYVEMPEFETKEEFLLSLKEGKIAKHKAGLWVHFRTTLTKLKKGF